MKKLSFFFLLLSLWGLGGFSARAQQGVTLIGEEFASGAVTFTVNMSAASPTWVLVEYNTTANPANMSRATFTSVQFDPQDAGTFSPADEPRGFWVESNTAVTVTATLEDVAPNKFSWCAYALSAPPRAKVKPEGGYSLHGTPPFTIITAGGTFTENNYDLAPGTCITSMTDFTYNPKGFLFDPPMTVTANAPATVCAGDVAFTAIATGSTTTAMNYTWNIAGTESTTHTNPYITALTTANTDPYTAYTYTVYVTNANGCTSTVSEAGTVTVYAVPVFTNVSSATVCSGMAAALSVTASNVTPSATYTWIIDGYPAETTTTSTYTAPVLTATAATGVTYTVQITNDTGCTSEAVAGTITVNPLPEPAFLSAPSAVCPNSEATFTVSGAEPAPGSYCFTYQCPECLRNPFLTGEDVPPAAHCQWNSECTYTTADTYSVVMPDSGSMTVWVQAMNQYGCTNTASTVVTIYDAFDAGSISTAGEIICSGDAVTAITGTDASGGDGAIAYEWREGANILGVTATYDPAAYNSTPGTYTFTRWAKDNTCSTTWTQSAGQWVLTVHEAFTAGAITTASTTTDLGTPSSVTVASVVSASGGDGNITYQWRRSDGTSSTTLTDSNETYALNTDGDNYSTVGIYYFTRYAKDGVCTTDFTASNGQYTLIVSVTPPPDSGTFTWSCNTQSSTQTWSETLRNSVSGCTSVSELSSAQSPTAQYLVHGSNGYYYNWTCVNKKANELCPSPWRVPTQTDFSDLINCTNAGTLISVWGYTGNANEGTVWDSDWMGGLWSSSDDASYKAFYLYYNDGYALEVSSTDYKVGLNVRCVQ